MRNRLLDMLKAGKKSAGTFFSAGNAAMAECLALSGIDYFIVDTEHGPFDVETTADIIRGASLYDTPVLVRVKDSTRPSILKMLDIGASGLVIPNIHTAQEVKNVIEYGKYYPQGMRGMAASRSAGYGFANFAENLANYMAVSNEHTLLLPQCETRGCLENIEEIASIDGVAGIFVGPFDLSVALGKPTKFNDPEFKEALNRILNACKSSDKYVFTFATTPEGVRSAYEQGFDSVILSTETALFVQGVKKVLAYIAN